MSASPEVQARQMYDQAREEKAELQRRRRALQRRMAEIEEFCATHGIRMTQSEEGHGHGTKQQARS